MRIYSFFLLRLELIDVIMDRGAEVSQLPTKKGKQTGETHECFLE